MKETTERKELIVEDIEVEKRKEYDRYMVACSRGGEGFNIDDFPYLKAEIKKQEKEKQAQKIQVKSTNPVDIWLENSLKENNLKLNLNDSFIDSWVVED